MLKQTLYKYGLVFSVYENDKPIDFKNWPDTNDCIYYFPLSTLVDNGNATFKDNACYVPFGSIYLLDSDDRCLLDVPKEYPFGLRLCSNGILKDDTFSYKIEYLSHVPDGEILIVEQCGYAIVINGKTYLFNRKQFEFVDAVKAFNGIPSDCKSFETNLIFFERIKALGEKCGCVFDSYLENENVLHPDKIKITIDRDEEGFSITPEIESEENNGFIYSYERNRKVPRVFPVQNEKGERTRVVLTDSQKESLTELKRRGRRIASKDEVKEIIDHALEYFDPDQFDLSALYSDRVIEIGVYKPRFYPFICPYKSCWIAGATVETDENGTTKITVSDESELSDLNVAIDEAERAGEDIIHYQGTLVGIEDAKYLSNLAERQISKKNGVIELDEEGSKKVLIIKENADQLEFEAEERNIETGDHYTLYTNSYLRKDFKLKNHQQEGVAWLQHLYNNKATGCLMADDMGLGKTLQILYFIDWHFRNHPIHKPYLIVAPVSLLENWRNEYERFFNEPRLKITTLTSKDVPRKFDKRIVDLMSKEDIILTNYESLRISQLNFCAVNYEIVVLDEAQKIKSPGTLVTNAAKALKSQFKIAMTGTPVENSLLDLWCIMDFCVPGLLDNAKSFSAKYQLPLRNKDTDIVALGNEIHESLGIHFMRRMKMDVAQDLPKKIEVKQKAEMPELQKTVYLSAIEKYNKGIQPNMLVTIQNIRAISEHPFLYQDLLDNHNIEELLETSARLIVTEEFLNEIRDRNEKAIIFVERKEVQRMLQRMLHEKYGLIPKIINGDTPASSSKTNPNKQSRQSSIDEFQSKPGFDVIIMSPVAAGMGLNVTEANNIIHYSRHWNPAKENQATDRAYRIGQTRTVRVYYPMAVSKDFHSFDLTLDELLSKKTQLATSTIFPTERVEVRPDEIGSKLFDIK